MTQPLSISGPAGTLEALLSDPDADRLAVLCHPHPLYGGSMGDLVLATLAKTLAEHGIASLRFNFRGVGASGGTHSGSGGEVEDLRAVLDWVASNHPASSVLLGGYSFGASIVSLLMPEASAERILLIAPPVGNLPATAPDGRVPVDVFTGDRDAFVDQSALAGWNHAHVHLIEGADHFFNGRLAELERALHEALEQT